MSSCPLDPNFTRRRIFVQCRRFKITVCVAACLTFALGNLYLSIRLPPDDPVRAALGRRHSWMVAPRHGSSSYNYNTNYDTKHDLSSSCCNHTQLFPIESTVSLIQRQDRIRAILSSESNGSSAIFILCKDTDSHLAAYPWFHSISWAHIYTIPPQTAIPWGSFSYFYYHLLGHVLNPSPLLDNATHFRWIGSLDYELLSIPDIEIIAEFLVNDSSSNSSSTEDYSHIQVFSFAQHSEQDYFSQQQQQQVNLFLSHPDWTRLIQHLLLTGGESLQLIQTVLNNDNHAHKNHSTPFIQHLHSNHWMTRPHHMQSFIKWSSRILIVFFFFHDLKKDMEMIQDENGTLSLHTTIPALGDFLVSYFFYTRGLTIMTLDDYRSAKTPLDYEPNTFHFHNATEQVVPWMYVFLFYYYCVFIIFCLWKPNCT